MAGTDGAVKFGLCWIVCSAGSVGEDAVAAAATRGVDEDLPRKLMAFQNVWQYRGRAVGSVGHLRPNTSDLTLEVASWL